LGSTSPCSPTSCLGCDASCEVQTSARPRCALQLSLAARSQMIGDENRRGEGNTARRLEDGKTKSPSEAKGVCARHARKKRASGIALITLSSPSGCRSIQGERTRRSYPSPASAWIRRTALVIRRPRILTAVTSSVRAALCAVVHFQITGYAASITNEGQVRYFFEATTARCWCCFVLENTKRRQVVFDLLKPVRTVSGSWHRLV